MPIGSHWTQVETVDSSHRLTPDQIEAQQFDTVLRGYDPSAVVNFLRDVARSYRDLVVEAEEARAAAASHVCPEPETIEVVREVVREVVVAPGDPYSGMAEEVASVLRAAYASAADVRSQAEQEAETTRAEAARQLDELDRTLADRREQAEAELAAARARSEEEAASILEAARREASRLEQEIEARRAALRDHEQDVRDRLTGAASVLDRLLEELPAIPANAESGDSGDSDEVL